MQEEKTIVNMGDVKEADDTYYVDDIPFNTTPDGRKLLDELFTEHNELNHIKEKQMETKAKRVRLGGTCEILDATLPRYEVEIPLVALDEIGINPENEPLTDQIQFIQENGRVYLEKA